MNPRDSDICCPVCFQQGSVVSLMKPDYENGWYDWDCHKCGFEMPSKLHFETEDILKYAAGLPDPVKFLEDLKNMHTY